MNYHNLKKLNRDPKRSKKRDKRYTRMAMREEVGVTQHWLYNHAVARLPHSWLKKVFGVNKL